PSELVDFQSAYAGHPSRSPDESMKIEVTRFGWDKPRAAQPAGDAFAGGGKTQLEAIAEAATAAVAEANIALPKPPWLPVLPEALSLDDLVGPATEPNEG